MECDINKILSLVPHLPQDEVILISKAYEFAKQAHEGQKRKSGEPYFYHVFETAKILAEYEMDSKTISAGLLHDTIEDTHKKFEDISREFGEDIAEMVNGVTKLGKVKYEGHVRHAESLRKLFMATAKDARVIIIKLADRLHNLRTLEFMSSQKQERIAQESIEIYAPLADRLGMGKLKGEIEDAAFPFAFPNEYKEIKKLTDGKREKINELFKTIVPEIESKFTSAGIHIIKIKHRVKHAYSLWRKLQRYEMNIDKIQDLAAIRIIVKNIEECYAAMGIIHSLWQPIPGKIKDYIATPKFNEYQSIHTTVFIANEGIVEFQIRTSEMDMNAEFGFAAHYQYKKNPLQKADNDKFKWLNEFKNLSDSTKEPSIFISELKSDFFNDQIFVFTPHGDVIDLPKNSTPIDFAFHLHTKIGEKTLSAKVNGNTVPLDTILESEDIVEIITDEKSKPTEKWLSFAKTNMAKRRIKDYLNTKKGSSILDKFIPKKPDTK